MIVPVYLNDFSGKDFSKLKSELSDALISEIVPVGKKIKDLMSDKINLQKILMKGKEKANIIAEENLKKIRDIVGLL